MWTRGETWSGFEKDGISSRSIGLNQTVGRSVLQSREKLDGDVASLIGGGSFRWEFVVTGELNCQSHMPRSCLPFRQ